MSSRRLGDFWGSSLKTSGDSGNITSWLTLKGMFKQANASKRRSGQACFLDSFRDMTSQICKSVGVEAKHIVKYVDSMSGDGWMFEMYFMYEFLRRPQWFVIIEESTNITKNNKIRISKGTIKIQKNYKKRIRQNSFFLFISPASASFVFKLGQDVFSSFVTVREPGAEEMGEGQGAGDGGWGVNDPLRELEHGHLISYSGIPNFFRSRWAFFSFFLVFIFFLFSYAFFLFFPIF